MYLSEALATPTTVAPVDASATLPRSPPKPRKNWDGIAAQILNSDVELTTDQDPNVGGDSTLNSFFQRIYGDADEDTKKAMMKSYSESGGTTLSTNWEEVRKAKVEVKPPAGSEWKKWN
jgi:suppressor of G2 allele of SKP1